VRSAARARTSSLPPPAPPIASRLSVVAGRTGSFGTDSKELRCTAPGPCGWDRIRQPRIAGTSAPGPARAVLRPSPVSSPTKMNSSWAPLPEKKKQKPRRPPLSAPAVVFSDGPATARSAPARPHLGRRSPLPRNRRTRFIGALPPVPGRPGTFPGAAAVAVAFAHARNATLTLPPPALGRPEGAGPCLWRPSRLITARGRSPPYQACRETPVLSPARHVLAAPRMTWRLDAFRDPGVPRPWPPSFEPRRWR